MSNAICKWCKREWLHLGMDDKCPYCRVRELEFYRADALKEMRQQLELLCAYHVEGVTARIGSVLARVRELEAFKTRVMAWARGRCGACEHEGSEDDTCYNCQSDYEQSNWTLPQALEVGE